MTKLVLAYVVDEPEDFTARAAFYQKLGPQHAGFSTFIVDEMHGEALEPKRAPAAPKQKRGNTVGWRQRKAERDAARSRGDGPAAPFPPPAAAA